MSFKTNVKIWKKLFTIFCFPAFAIWCYRCNSATPGCSDNFNWKGIGFLGESCPEDDDICVKVVERKGGKNSEMIHHATKINEIMF